MRLLSRYPARGRKALAKPMETGPALSYGPSVIFPDIAQPMFAAEQPGVRKKGTGLASAPSKYGKTKAKQSRSSQAQFERLSACIPSEEVSAGFAFAANSVRTAR
jgi:hypothetical protein